MRIGILGGTFDPPHRAHSWIGIEVRRRLALDRVALMIANQPPHKSGQPRADGYHRHAMAALETLDADGVAVSSWELRQTGVSYTVDTMEALRRRFPDHEYCFIAGGDSLSELTTWKDWRRLLAEFTLAFVPRASREAVTVDPEVEKRLVRLAPGQPESVELSPGRSYLLDRTPPDVSSTAIREALEAGRRPPAEVLSPSVYRYIRKYRLYGHNPGSRQESLFDH